MAAHITIEEVKAWVENTKLSDSFAGLDDKLEEQVSNEVLARLSANYDVSLWVAPASTPLMARRLIAMRYAGWMYQKIYSEDEGLSDYGTLLMTQADLLLEGILKGTVVLVDIPDGVDRNLRLPGYYPTDASSAQEPTYDDSSLGPAKFSMGRTF